jgi:hypothetical protein
VSLKIGCRYLLKKIAGSQLRLLEMREEREAGRLISVQEFGERLIPVLAEIHTAIENSHVTKAEYENILRACRGIEKALAACLKPGATQEAVDEILND